MKIFGKMIYLILAIFFVGLFFVLENASIAGVIFPFSFSMMFALVWANQKYWLVCPAYLISAIVVNHSLAGVVSAICSAVFIVVPYLIHYFCKKGMSVWELVIYSVLSQSASIAFAATSGEANAVYYSVASTLIGVVFMLGCITLFEAIFVRGCAYRLSAIEMVAGSSILMALTAGMVCFEINSFSFLKLFVSFLLLAITYCSKNYYSVFVAAIFGLGTLISTSNPLYLAPFMLWALAISPFKTYRKYFSAIALICCELLIGFYFKLYPAFDWLAILPTAISSVIFMIIPDKIYNSVKGLFDLKGDRAAIKNVVNRNREILHRRLASLSDVFGEMNKVFKSLVKKNLSENEVKKLLRDEVISRNCETCPDRARCHRTYQEETNRVLDELMDIAFEKGKVTLLDIPNYLNSRCGRVNGIITATNGLCKQYKSYSGMLSNIDTSKLLIADQLGGISSVMKNLSKEVDTEIAFDGKREQKIVDELLFNDIVCSDIVVYEKDAHTCEASLVVRSMDAEQIKIPDIIGKICKSKMSVYEKFPSTKPGWTTLSLKTAPKMDCVFAIASQTKNGSSSNGDNHSVLRLDGDKFMFALCDGMGSGEEAEKTSEVAIGLIENFYKAGFESEVVLSSVNKLLSLQKEDKFSAIDVCILDLKNGLADFIKMASPASIIMSSESSKVIGSENLPLGIIDKVEPVTKKLVVGDGDNIILMTDGVADSFASDQAVEDFVKSCYSLNPQNIADKILEQALANNDGRAKDDMSVLVVKVFNI